MAIQFDIIFTPIVVYVLAIYVSETFLLASQAKERVNMLVQSGVESGAKLLLDGRNIVVTLNSFFNCLIFFRFLLRNFKDCLSIHMCVTNRSQDMNLAILLVQPSYQISLPTWNATRYFLNNLEYQCFY
jgi:hypothetical protein